MRVKQAIGLCLVLSTMCATAIARDAERLTPAQAAYAAAASSQLIPGSDIEYGYHPHIVTIADLDKASGPQIVYLQTAFNTGSTSDATNSLIVMTRLRKGDKRGVDPVPKNAKATEAYYRDVRRSGYADDAGTHIPGEVSTLQVSGDRIEVGFLSKKDSPTCKRSKETDAGRKATTHCPPPGWHTWVYAWTPGKLKRVACLDGARAQVRCNPAHETGL
ncbi:hypothetical protein [Luteimonas aquatica]|uniref:hypothetical protein n=1 Tax=Luteimonas aquatica TaxID=450364 RepID=UPI001F59D1FF|nr:hypothetical protein [Luteimonas aquatica]